MWRAKPEVARKLYPAIRLVFEYARILLRDDHVIAMPDNPAAGRDLKAMGFEPPAALRRGDIRHCRTEAARRSCRLRASDAVAARALEFPILTNVRTDAVLKAGWAEFDLNRQLWSVPLANLKDRKYREGGVPGAASARAVEIVREMEGSESRTAFLSGVQSLGKPFSNMALLTFCSNA